MKFECPEGHIYETEFNHFKKGIRCPKCGGTKRLNYEEVKLFIEKEGYVLLDSEYKNNITKMSLVCPKGCRFKMKFNKFKDSKRRCPKCSLGGTSKIEIEFKDEIKRIFSKSIINENVRLLKREADIIIDGKFAINFHGDYWHCNPNVKNYDSPNYFHKIKSKTAKEIWEYDDNVKLLFEENGYKYIVVWENEWRTNKEKCIKEKLAGIPAS
jgi:G:T-mismatch repair DNA endonuclease (very short patch repair protein)